MNITGIILTKDGSVAKTKASLDFCDEVLIVKNINIADFAKVRNEALNKAKNEWIIFVDDDEIVSNILQKEILEAVNDESINGYFLTRRDFIFGRELKYGEFSRHGWFGNAQILRLGRKSVGRWIRPIHEEWKIEGNISSLKNPLFHYPHKDLKTFLTNINYFSTLHAQALEAEGKKSSLFKIIVWPFGKFVYNYIFRLGFIDRMPGFVVALVMSFHSFLAWSKEWTNQNQK